MRQIGESGERAGDEEGEVVDTGLAVTVGDDAVGLGASTEDCRQCRAGRPDLRRLSLFKALLRRTGAASCRAFGREPPTDEGGLAFQPVQARRSSSKSGDEGAGDRP